MGRGDRRLDTPARNRPGRPRVHGPSLNGTPSIESGANHLLFGARARVHPFARCFRGGRGGNGVGVRCHPAAIGTQREPMVDSEGRQRPRLAGPLQSGRGWFRTSDLSRVKRGASEGRVRPEVAANREVPRSRASPSVGGWICVDYLGLLWIWAVERDFCPKKNAARDRGRGILGGRCRERTWKWQSRP